MSGFLTADREFRFPTHTLHIKLNCRFFLIPLRKMGLQRRKLAKPVVENGEATGLRNRNLFTNVCEMYLKHYNNDPIKDMFAPDKYL